LQGSARENALETGLTGCGEETLIAFLIGNYLKLLPDLLRSCSNVMQCDLQALYRETGLIQVEQRG
jgi:hypothetical protein